MRSLRRRVTFYLDGHSGRYAEHYFVRFFLLQVKVSPANSITAVMMFRESARVDVRAAN